MEFGDILKALRRERGLSQDEMAALLGTTKQVISRYETKQRVPKLSIVSGYAQRLGIPLALLTGEETTAATGSDETQKPTEDTTAAAGNDESQKPSEESTAASAEATTAADGEETKAEEKKSGCGAVVGFGAVAVLAAAAAAVALKKKD